MSGPTNGTRPPRTERPSSSASGETSDTGEAGDGPGTNVVSIAVARARKERRISRPQNAVVDPRFDDLDLRGIEFEEMSEGARQLYWFNLTNYARHLYAGARDISLLETVDEAKFVIRPEHVQEAERGRLARARQSQAELGLGFVLEAAQIFAVAAAGALATRMDLNTGEGIIAFGTCLSVAVAVFFVREYLRYRDEV